MKTSFLWLGSSLNKDTSKLYKNGLAVPIELWWTFSGPADTGRGYCSFYQLCAFHLCGGERWNSTQGWKWDLTHRPRSQRDMVSKGTKGNPWPPSFANTQETELATVGGLAGLSRHTKAQVSEAKARWLEARTLITLLGLFLFLPPWIQSNQLQTSICFWIHWGKKTTKKQIRASHHLTQEHPFTHACTQARHACSSTHISMPAQFFSLSVPCSHLEG